MHIIQNVQSSIFEGYKVDITINCVNAVIHNIRKQKTQRYLATAVTMFSTTAEPIFVINSSSSDISRNTCRYTCVYRSIGQHYRQATAIDYQDDMFVQSDVLKLNMFI